MSELSDFFKLMAEEKIRKDEQQRNSPAGKAIAAVQERLKTNNEMTELLEVFVEKKSGAKQVIVEKIVEKQVIVEKEVLNKDSFQQPAPQPVDPNIKGIQKKIQFLEQAIGRIAAAGPGSGEVNLRYLDDVDRSSIDDQRYMRYNATSKKFEFVDITLNDITTALGFTPVSNTVQILTSNFITVSASNTYDLSSLSSYNILDVISGGLTATLNMPINPANGQMVTFAVIRNTITLAKGAGTVNPPFAGGFALGTSFTYTYREVDDTWYRVG